MTTDLRASARGAGVAGIVVFDLGSLAPATVQLGPTAVAGAPATRLYGAGLVATAAGVVFGARFARRRLAPQIGDTTG